jgi:phosphoadenosine phosphosulfate reductase
MIAQDIDINLEDALSRCSPSFKKKLKYSIDLLQKAADLALKYSEDGFYLAFSGGKDSQCLYHVAKIAGVPFKSYMNLTSIDPPQVIMFVKRNYPSVLLNKPVDSIYNIAVEKKFLLPSRIIRWCCAELKEGGGAGTVCLTGIRKAESPKRAKRSPVEVSNRSFAGSLEDFYKWQFEQIKKKLPSINQDQFSQRERVCVKCGASTGKTKSLSIR